MLIPVNQSKLADIVCYTTAYRLAVLQLGVTLNEERIFWSLLNTPKELVVGDRIYFACNKKIRGYFRLLEQHIGKRRINKELSYEGSHLILGEWKELDPINIKDFKKETGGSWRYYKKIMKKLKNKDDNY